MKVLKVAAIVVGTVAGIALVATGLGAPIGAGILGVTWGTIAAAAGLAGALLNVVSPSKTKPNAGSAVGSQTEVTLDPNAGKPYAMGRTFYAGTLAHQDTFGANNQFIGSALIWSGGSPINAIEAFQVDQVTVSFSGGAATGAYAGFMWLHTQLGAQPESAALAASQGTLPGWDSSSKLSGYAAGLLELKFDKNGKVFAGGFPQIGAVLQGVLVYDPRLDSTYPGGSGSCRALTESTYVYSENPALHALTFALGRWQNGKRVLGIGMPVDGIVVQRFVDFANTCDANGWKVGGVISSLDDKWNALKQICQAGGGQPIRLGGMLSCDFQAPRVSLATVTAADLAGDIKVTATKPRRDRFNTAVARYRSEAHGWQVISASPVSVSTYVTADGGTRTKEIDLTLVQQVNQATQLVTYEICNSREFEVGIPLKPRFIGYKPGDCLTLNIPEAGLASQPVVLGKRSLDPTTVIVSFDTETETGSKHAFALGQTGTAPPTPSLTPSDLSNIAAPGASAWSVSPITLTGTAGESVPVLHITGATDDPRAEAVLIEYRVHGTSPWLGPFLVAPTVTIYDIPGITPGEDYDVAISYQVRGVKGARRVLTSVTAGSGSIGVSALGVSPLPAAITVPTSAGGTPLNPIDGFVLKVFKGADDVTLESTGTTYTISATSDVSGVTHSGDGVFTGATSMAATTGYVEVTVVNGATAIVRITYTKVPAGSAASAVVPTHIGIMNDTGTYAVIATLADIAVTAGATLSADASALFDVSGGYTNQVKLTYQNITDGGGEVDFSGSENSLSCIAAGNPWGFSTSGTWTNGLGATKVMRVRLYQRESAGSHASSGVDGYLNGHT